MICHVSCCMHITVYHYLHWGYCETLRHIFFIEGLQQKRVPLADAIQQKAFQWYRTSQWHCYWAAIHTFAACQTYDKVQAHRAHSLDKLGQHGRALLLNVPQAWLWACRTDPGRRFSHIWRRLPETTLPTWHYFTSHNVLDNWKAYLSHCYDVKAICLQPFLVAAITNCIKHSTSSERLATLTEGVQKKPL